jgi:outer membrane lipoprotein-sorting protein
MVGFQSRTPTVAALALAGVLTQSPEELLRHSDVGGFPPSSFRARLVLKSLPQDVSHEIEVWRSGESKTLIRLLDPKERGKYLLRLEGQLWLLTPSAKKPVHLSPSYRLYGGATLDEVLGIRLARDYQVESVSRAKDPRATLVAFELRAKSEGMLFPQVHYVVNEATERPVSATYKLRSGRDATQVEFVQWNDSGLVYARRVVVKDLLRKGALTEVEVLELQERTIPDGLFSLEDSAARRALDNPPSRSQ